MIYVSFSVAVTLTMPVINSNDNNGSQRSTFRPPWVKEGPSPLPMPSAPWVPRAKEMAAANAENQNNENTQKPVLRKQTKVTIPIDPRNQQLNQSPAQERAIPIKVVHESSEPTWRREKPQLSPDRITPHPVTKPPIDRTMPTTAPKPPPPPPAAPKPPPPPPMVAHKPPPPPPMAPQPPPMNNAAPSAPSKSLPPEKAAKIEALRSRPRRRPDWSDMMKEVESGKQLRHVQCNDRSAPVIPKMKAKEGQFVYESEKKGDDNSHVKLLKDIQSGVKLKKVKCNDRSKPNLDGLRKFRRQMTIEEQIQKSVSMADVVAAAVQPDELDDIDKVRDDLQSAKQMLALELRNKEAMERENKRLLARLANLEAELEKEKACRKMEPQKGIPVRTEEDERIIVKLKEEAQEADRLVKDMEIKYHATAEQLDNTRRKLESAWLRNQELECQLKSLVVQGTPAHQQLMKQPSKKFIPISNGGSVDLISDDEEESETETEEESENEGAATQEKQIARELKLLTAKLRTFREKQAGSLKERRILREQLKKKQKELREEKRKYKLLQKEVDKMACLMKDTDEEDEYEKDNSEEEESETDSESEESEEEVVSDSEAPYNSTPEEKRRFLLERTKRHENRLASLKKGNNLMKANIERLQDDVNKQRELSLTLQEDLNNILADLG